MPSTKPATQLRLRIFAGPNGSGKSTVIQFVRNYKTTKGFIGFGYYINADDIGATLKTGSFNFNSFDTTVANKAFREICLASGLINDNFTEAQFVAAYSLRSNKLTVKIKML